MRRTLTTAMGGPRLAAPKTKGSRRRVSLTRGAMDALRAHLARQLQEIDRAGSLWQENGLVFASELGEPLDRRDLTSRGFKPLLKRAKLSEKTRFHDLRHTCATLLLTKNVNPKVVSEMLGHATIAITLTPTRTCSLTCKTAPPEPSKKPSADALQYGCSKKAPAQTPGLFHCEPYFYCFCRSYISTGGRARTDTVLSHHRILSPARLPIPPLRREDPFIIPM